MLLSHVGCLYLLWHWFCCKSTIFSNYVICVIKCLQSIEALWSLWGWMTKDFSYSSLWHCEVCLLKSVFRVPHTLSHMVHLQYPAFTATSYMIDSCSSMKGARAGTPLCDFFVLRDKKITEGSSSTKVQHYNIYTAYYSPGETFQCSNSVGI